MTAKSQFDRNEFERLVDSVNPDRSNDRDVVALWLMASHLLLQKRGRISTQLSNSTAGNASTKPKHSQSIQENTDAVQTQILVTRASALHSRFANDSIVTYIYGIILARSPQRADQELARELMLNAVKLCPYNWAAWKELSLLSSTIDSDAFLQSQELYPFYLLEKGTGAQELFARYPKWVYVGVKFAESLHNSREFKRAAAVFQQVQKLDKFSLAGIDVFSNCLYVLERLTDLSELAHFWMEVNPNACETNVVAGNFYSLKSDHEKAAMFFKRATVIDPSNTNAWLLLGHELIELRNPSAALAAYQSATQICPRDLRPWYAMGQLFELIHQNAFAVFYHNKALQLDPSDVRVWRALGNCYEKLGKAEEAKTCESKIKSLATTTSKQAASGN